MKINTAGKSCLQSAYDFSFLFLQRYSVAVYLVRVFTATDLFSQLKLNSVESAERCRERSKFHSFCFLDLFWMFESFQIICKQNLIFAPYLFKVQDKLRFDPESEIATTGLRVSLICPVSTHFWHGTTHSSTLIRVLHTVCCIITTVFSCFVFFCVFFAVGEDATRCALSGFDLCPSAMFRRSLLPADEWEEAHVDLPRLWQTCTFRAPYYRWVRSKKHVLTYPLLQH